MMPSAERRRARRKLSRREFCKTASQAVLGGWSISRLTGKDLGAHFKEAIVTKKIKEIRARVVSVKGTCSLGHKVGDVVTFTQQGVQGMICIHALYSMLPAVFAMMFGAEFPWLENPDKKTHPCTDAAYPVVFEIERIREG